MLSGHQNIGNEAGLMLVLFFYTIFQEIYGKSG